MLMPAMLMWAMSCVPSCAVPGFPLLSAEGRVAAVDGGGGACAASLPKNTAQSATQAKKVAQRLRSAAGGNGVWINVNINVNINICKAA